MSLHQTTRIRTLDLIRGVAVLGILAVNVAGFAAPDSAVYSPDMPRPGVLADHAAYLITFVLFEGKMRALFSMLFGASLLLFVERANATGRDGARLQARRLAWLLLFGYLHFALIWDGDILFLYAALGFVALALRNWRASQLVVAAGLILATWQVWGAAMWLPSVATELAVVSGTASPAAQKQHGADLAQYRAEDARDVAEAKLSWPAQVQAKWTNRADDPLNLIAYNWGETLPWMLLGMALLRSGFFAGEWPRRRMVWLAGAGLGLGGAATLGFALWASRSHYPEVTMHFATSFGLALPHLGMALGYAALLVLSSPLPLAGGAGGGPMQQAQLTDAPTPNPSRKREGDSALRRMFGVLQHQLEAAGRMAFSNYLGTSLVMAALCYGWGLGLFGQFGAAQRWTLVLLVWALILAWSQPWLTRYRQGPLEWLWRSLTEWRVLRFRR
ncbi:MAG: DUF418 domain-containing protein [Pseudomonadota bacterium]|nr:DUF418 domain-containing protein [Pseudomonadota bacterium]